VSGSYGGTVVSHQAPTWTDRVENRVELSGGSTSEARDFNVASFNSAFSGPSIDLTSKLITGHKRVEDNDPNDVCAPLSVPINGVPFALKWVSAGDAVTITLEIFPATPFSCGYAAYRMTPPEYPTATTTLTALQSGAPVSLHFVGGSTYTQGMNNINTEALTWDFTVGMQVGP
jgi:hypothetical protein